MNLPIPKKHMTHEEFKENLIKLFVDWFQNGKIQDLHDMLYIYLENTSPKSTGYQDIFDLYTKTDLLLMRKIGKNNYSLNIEDNGKDCETLINEATAYIKRAHRDKNKTMKRTDRFIAAGKIKKAMRDAKDVESVKRTIGYIIPPMNY